MAALITDSQTLGHQMRTLLALIIALVVWLPGAAQTDTVVSLVDVYAGPTFYELDGHTLLRIRTPQADMAVSWGLFDFTTDDFLYRFVKGETDYMCGAFPFYLAMAEPRAQQRRTVEHVLNLTPSQTRRLTELVTDNLRPANATYRYNYVLDNCATRPVRLVELAMGDTILFPPSALEVESSLPVTFRNVMRRNHRNYPWYQLGIDICLGSGVDRPLDFRQTTFAPIQLDGQLPGARTAAGIPVVKSSQVLLNYAPDHAIEGPTPWYETPAAAFGLVFLITVLITVRDIRRRRVTRWYDALLFGVFGLTGCLLTFLIFVSVHEATSPNWLYLWLNPLCLIVPIFIWIKRCKPAVLWYQIANFAALTAMCACWWWIPQSTNPVLWLLVAADMTRSGSYICLNYKK